MNFGAKIFFFFTFLTSAVISQENLDSVRIDNQEKALSKNIFFTLDDLDFYLELHDLNKSVLPTNDPNTAWLWTSYALSYSGKEPLESDFNFDTMTNPLYQKYIENSKFNPFRYALGMVQVGAVGYLAYKHIKKYGFLKK